MSPAIWMCQRCSRRILTRQQFIQELGKHSIRVDVQTLTPAISASLGRRGFAEAAQNDTQSTYLRIRKDLAFRCVGCGKMYCFDCLFNFAPPHPESGKACPACGGALVEM